MTLNQTPSAERVHIGFFGATNAGKSSLVNRVTGQSMSLVSPVSGTTTDPVKKAMELLPLGPVVIVDTPGFDDESALGKMRVERTKKELQTIDAAVLVCDSQKGITKTDEELIEIFRQNKTSYIIAYSKADLIENRTKLRENEIYVSAKSGENIDALKEKLARIIPHKSNKMGIVDSFVKKGDTVILVTPIDEAAPKGRIILPQQQVLRNLLDIGAISCVVQVEELSALLSNLKTKPAAVITDSQAFGAVSKIVPEEIPLTSFSILLANYRRMLDTAVDGVLAINALKDGDKILIAEGCTHHRQCNDIGSVKIPAWIRKHTGKELSFDVVSGHEFPEDLKEYSLILHCGGCMITEREVDVRRQRAENQNIPFTNYGIAIAFIHGILKRSVEVFPELYKKL